MNGPDPVRPPAELVATVAPWRWTLALAAVTAVVYGLVFVLPWLPNYLGLGTHDGWFIDLYALLAAGEARLRGFPLYFSNPLDVYHRPHSYSNWWLALGDLGLERADTLWLGGLLAGLFALVGLLGLQPRTRREFFWGALVLCAPSVQLCVLRANNDLVVFLLLAVLAPCLTSGLPVARLCAAFLVAVAAGLKYYPAAAGLLLLWDRSPRLLVWRLVVFGALGVLVLLSVYEDTLYFARTLPAPTGLFSFGAAGLFEWLGLGAMARKLLLAFLLAALAGRALTERNAPPMARAPSAAELSFLLGAVLLAACFWVGMNWSYRWIFALWLLPLLLRDAAGSELLRPGERRTLLGLLPVCLWWEGASSLVWNLGPGKVLGLPLSTYSAVLWRVGQPVTWAVVLLLTLVCLRFAWWAVRAAFLRARRAPELSFPDSR